MHTGVVMSMLSVVLSMAFVASAEQKNLLVALKFVPQESVESASIALPSSIIDRSVEIVLEDGRRQDSPDVIGTGTDDDDRPFPIMSSVDVLQFVKGAISQIAAASAIKAAAPADRKLRLRLTRFFVNESNKAVGSTYMAEVHFAYVLLDARGSVLVESASSGGASRYGRARSAANCSEVLSDALKDAFTKVLGDQALLTAWKSGTAAPSGGVSISTPTPAKESIEERLRRLDDLLKKGLVTPEEYKKKRAEILKDA